MGDTSLAANTYVSFITFTRDGREKQTPVWIADLGDGTMGFTTASSSWKVKRLANNPNVKLEPCDARGRVEPGTVMVDGTAALVQEGSAYERVRTAIRQKYGWQMKLIAGYQKLAGLLGRGASSDAAVIVTVH